MWGLPRVAEPQMAAGRCLAGNQRPNDDRNPVAASAGHFQADDDCMAIPFWTVVRDALFYKDRRTGVANGYSDKSCLSPVTPGMVRASRRRASLAPQQKLTLAFPE